VHCTFPQFDVLNQLDREPNGLTFVELSRRLLVTAGNLTGIVERLHAGGSSAGPSTPRTAAPSASH